MTEVYLVRHTECSKDSSDTAAHGDSGFKLPLTEHGKKQARKLARHLPPDFDETVFGTQQRMRETLVELNLPKVRIYPEDYLNSRNRLSLDDNSSDTLFGSSDTSKETFASLTQRAAERLMDRIRRRAKDAEKFLVITSREIILAFRFRLRGTPTGEKQKYLDSLSHGDGEIVHALDVLPGEAVVVTDIDPRTGEKQPSFRWERVISPEKPARDKLNFEYHCVRNDFTEEELLNTDLWG